MADREAAGVTSALWRRAPEVGTVLGIRFVVALASLLGRRAARAFLWLLSVYYVIVSARARRASRAFLRRVGEPARLSNVVRHVHTFACVTLDRLFFVQDRVDRYVIECHGKSYLDELAAKKKGAIMLGSHLGSFEAMRAVGREEGKTISVVVDNRSAARLARVLKDLSPEANVKVIAVDPDGMGTALAVREALKRGELVGILADRTVEEQPDAANPGRLPRNVTVDFLGGKAAFPAGPYLLAHALRCEVVQVFGIYSEPNRYDLHCVPFAETVRLDGSREEALRRYAQEYASRLEQFARESPYNWFNFYEFWRGESDASDTDATARRATPDSR